ncbi:MAG: hypothetical protein JEY79_01155 [Pseudodesulfovibrio sp.]|nr:hypothetical protein [Pseudodesulfovibrio sp.]
MSIQKPESVVYIKAGTKTQRITFNRTQTIQILKRNGYSHIQAKNAWLNIAHGGSAILDNKTTLHRAI